MSNLASRSDIMSNLASRSSSDIIFHLCQKKCVHRNQRDVVQRAIQGTHTKSRQSYALTLYALVNNAKVAIALEITIDHNS
jgi:hypothetical protein